MNGTDRPKASLWTPSGEKGWHWLFTRSNAILWSQP